MTEHFNNRRLDELVQWAESIIDAANDPDIAPDGMILYGQDVIKKMIGPFLPLSKPFPHTLILGPPGSGKTHLARWIASKRADPFTEEMAPVRAEMIPSGGIFFIDEVHRQARPEFLFPRMEHGLCIIAATTRPELIEPAFASRFLLQLDVEPLNQAATEEMLAALLGPDEVIPLLARASVGNPRQAQQIAAAAMGLKTRDPELILSTTRINADGMKDLHLKILQQLKRIGRPIGVSQLATLLYTNDLTIKEHERLLLNYELIDLTTTGRALTRKGDRYLELTNKKARET